MGYLIRYSPEDNGKYPMRTAGVKTRRLALWGLIVVLAVVLLLAVDTAAVREFLIPGDAAVTEIAIDELVSNVRGGEGVGKSVVTFCQEILSGANAA